jgi:serine/threonine-protein phosphatase 6 regulatory ankyrin repeat subunit B
MFPPSFPSSLSASSSSFVHTPINQADDSPMTENEIWEIVESDNPIDEQMILKFSVLLKSGFDPFKIDLARRMNLLLQKASEKGNTEIVRLILTPSDDIKGFDVCSFMDNIKEKINAKNEFGFTALHFASNGENLEIVEMLVNAGASIDIKNAQEFTPLHFAVLSDRNNIVRFFITQNPESINTAGFYGRTALHFASDWGNLEMVKMLVEAGAKIDIQDNEGNTPLHKVIIQDNTNFEVVQMLVKAGAPIDIQNNNGSTPLYVAAGKDDNNSIIEFLIAQPQINPETLNAKNRDGATALHIAKNLEMVKMLVEAGATSDIPNNEGNTRLHLAALFNEVEIVEFLIAVPPQVDFE